MKSFSKTVEGHRRERIRSRILFPFTIVVLFVIGTFLFVAYWFEGRAIETDLRESVNAVDRLFHQSLDNGAGTMLAALTVIARDEKVKAAFLARDREALLTLTLPLFESLKKSSRISHFYFTGPDLMNFLRVHHPERYGDFIERDTTIQAVARQAPVQGIEVGVLGTFALRVVVPWRDGRRVIGYLELSQEIDRITDSVHDVLGADVLVAINSPTVEPDLREAGWRMLGQERDWNRFGNVVLVGRAMDDIPQSLAGTLTQKGISPEGTFRIDDDGRDLYVAFLPLSDASGREVGRLIVSRDATESKREFRSVMTTITVVSVLFGGSVFVVFFVVLGRVEYTYRHQREIELQLTRAQEERQKLVQTEKLSEMGLMISEIAHQLNNPLVGVVNTTQLAEREADDPNRVRELLGEIRKAGRDCQAFVKRMLEFTRVSKFDRRTTILCILIRETVSLFRQSAGERHEVILELPANSPVLDVDPVLIGHALFNLLTNAAQASPSSGRIFVGLKAETNQSERKTGWSISVRDEGPGLNDQDVDKLFVPFYTTRTTGTGLGLPVVLHVALVHEGYISAINADEGGAIFALWLPDAGLESA